jgi:tetratricopeptide (TPR) repeat protein
MVLFGVLASFVAAVLYSSGITAPAYLDDPTVLNNAESYIATRTLGYASFWLSHQVASLLGFVFPWDVTIYYRIPNVIIHVLAATAVFWLAKELTGKRITAGLAGAFFLVHPIQTQAVTYISQRFESQAALFMFLSAAAYVRFRKGHSRWWIAGTVLFGVVAALTKETSVALPLWLILLEVTFFSGIPRLRQVALWLPFVAVVAYPGWKALGGAGKTLKWIPFELYLLTQGAVLLEYLEMIFIPGKQFLLYDFAPATGITAGVLASWGLLLSLTAMALYLSRRNRVGIFGILTFFVLLSPTSVIPLPDLIFEHRVYPALAGIAIALASAFPPRRLTVALFSVVFVFLGYRSFVRNAEWNDRVQFWELHRREFPQDVKILASLAANLATQGEIKKAIEVNLEAKKYLHRLNAFYSKEGTLIVDMNLSTLYTQMGDSVRALQEARQVLAVDPDNLMALRLVSRAQVELGEHEEARKTLERTLKVEPRDAESILRLRDLEESHGDAEALAKIEARIQELHTQATAAATNLEASKPPASEEPKEPRSKGALTAFFFGFLVVTLGYLGFAVLVFKQYGGEVIRWVRTGSTVFVDSAGSTSTEKVGDST